MTFREISRALRRGALPIALCIVLGMTLALAGSLLRTPVYVAEAQLFLGASEEADEGVVTRQDTAYLQQRMQSYAAVLGSPLLGERVSEGLDLDLTGAEVAGEMTVEVPAETVLLTVRVQDPVPERAQEIANAAGGAFSDLLAELEDAPGSTVDTVQVSTIRPAALPTTPTAPTTGVLLAVGALLGLAVGVAVAFVRESMDDTVRDVDELAAAGVPALAVVPRRDRRRRGEGLGAERGEALRRIRAHLGDRPGRRTAAPRTVTVLGPTARADGAALGWDLAGVFAAARLRTVLVEADLWAPRAAGLLGLPEQTPGLAEVLAGRLAVAEALRPGPNGLRVLPAGRAPDAGGEDLLDGPRMAEVLAEVSGDADVTIVVPPPLDQRSGAASLTTLSDGVVLAVRAGGTTRRELHDVTSLLHTLGAPLVGAVLESSDRAVPRRVS
ncbi:MULTISPECIES: Wzz/FepE/Etk N-terminal domain-containing protein [unclassified Modestobacter]|uniref:Wzz/FepE/Etk N-terminal domain-containing protein n=1 Tax=unclassified Modestobacter TaxID=2643866 RepID=UPI0022AAC9CE|nr:MULTISPECIES: Wzz/FepE/Etk N-terminal domain-containing protein [unclassified Modestobacter]MCZ2825646.1 Wzz/FepE/Etk N-terminal domain-containing protein [Modestobacter sp. VKM Ac-2981]MCZ2853289.1 Wzz/FepE/Etk N-terminal domain-containing protein [Modestobacter sp. VKM Ac-2982]